MVLNLSKYNLKYKDDGIYCKKCNTKIDGLLLKQINDALYKIEIDKDSKEDLEFVFQEEDIWNWDNEFILCPNCHKELKKYSEDDDCEIVEIIKLIKEIETEQKGETT